MRRFVGALRLEVDFVERLAIGAAIHSKRLIGGMSIRSIKRYLAQSEQHLSPDGGNKPSQATALDIPYPSDEGENPSLHLEVVKES